MLFFKVKNIKSIESENISQIDAFLGTEQGETRENSIDIDDYGKIDTQPDSGGGSDGIDFEDYS